jgi:glycopeptide antibiotics resistance protein
MTYDRRHHRLFWALSVLTILALTTLPFSDFVGHPHWARVEWVPFSAGLRPLDFLANVLLFLPFGLFAPWGGHPSARRRLALVAAAACLLSLSVEYYQVFCHGRMPAMSDVLANTLGAALGASAPLLRCAQSPA